MAGIAHGVQPLTPVALRYQVEPCASLAKFGYRRASTLPVWSSSEAIGNSSKNTITTGVRAGAAALARAGAWPGRTSLETGETARNSRAKTSGAGVAKRIHSRTAGRVAYSAVTAAPAARAMASMKA